MALETRSAAILCFGSFEVDLRAGELRKQGLQIKLQEQPLRVLVVLLQRAGEVVSREELRAQIWPADTFVDFDNSLNTSINKLREALGDSAENPRFIETLPRRGYRFIAPVTSIGRKESAASSSESDGPRPQRPSWLWMFLAVAALLLAVGFGGWWLRRSSSPGIILTASLSAPSGAKFDFIGDFAGPPVLSPEGTRVAFCASSPSGGRSLWIHDLASGASQPLSGTNGATFPFWSPDAASLGFFADGKLKAIRLASSEVNVLADAPVGRGGAWGRGDSIIFSPDTHTGIFRIAATGGMPRPVTQVDPNRHTTHRWPFFLPDGRHFVYLATSHEFPRGEKGGIYIASLDGGEPRLLVQSLGNPAFASGFLLFLEGANLLARKLDLAKLALTGEAKVVASNVIFDLTTWRGVFASSQNGVLVYQTGVSQGGNLLNWYDRAGKLVQSTGERRMRWSFRLSPDGKRVAVSEGDVGMNIFVYDLANNARMRLTLTGEGDIGPVWSPDGRWIAYGKHHGGGPYNLFRKHSDGSGPEEQLSTYNHDRIPLSWSSDGRYLLYSEGTLGVGDIGAVPLFGDQKPLPVVRLGVNAYEGQFSPDGRWVAYISGQGGDQEVYVTSFPDHAGTWQVTTKGCTEPRWNLNGREIFCLSADNQLMAIEVDGRGSSFRVGAVRPLFAVPLHASAFNMWSYDVSPDSQRFLFGIDASSSNDLPLTVVVNWVSQPKM